MTVRDDTAHAHTQGGRFGRLAPAPAGGAEVRCACSRCGAHLLATPVGAGTYAGVCSVCAGEVVTPVHQPAS